VVDGGERRRIREDAAGVSPTMAAPAPPIPAARAEPGASASTDPAWAESDDDVRKALQKNDTRNRRVTPS